MTDTLTTGHAWQALVRHHEQVRDRHLRELFAEDPARVERLRLEAAGIHADLSKHRVTAETVSLLLDLARERGVAERRDAMFRGDHVNRTEDRPALHVALRMPRGRSLVVDGRDVVRDVHDVLDHMASLAERIRSGSWRGHTGRQVRAVVNIGIGGSDLGPAMAYEALRAHIRPGPDRAVRLERRRDRPRRGPSRPRSGRDARDRLVQDVHDRRDDDERAQRAAVAPRRARRRRGGDREARRRRLHQPRGGGRVRHRPGERLRILGLGRRSLLDGLGHRALDDDRDRPRGLPRPPGRVPRGRPPLRRDAARAQSPGADGPSRCLVPRLLRHPDARRPALRAVPRALPCLPAAARDGVERQARDARGRARSRRHRADRMGRAGDERPAQLPPAPPSGHAPRPGGHRGLRLCVDPAG